MSYAFVHETSNNQVKRGIALLIVAVLIAISAIVVVVNYGGLEGATSVSDFLARYTPDVIHNITPLKQFFLGVVAGIVFIPVPISVELLFYIGLKQGDPLFLSMGLAILGIVIGFLISYVIGVKLSRQIEYLVSTKHVYAIRRKVNKYGVYAILAACFFPSPADLLAFSLGITKYNVKRYLFFMILALIVKFSVVAALFFYFR